MTKQHSFTTAALAAALAMAAAPALADNGGEGMWLPSQLPGIAAELREAGYQGDPAALADLTRPPMSAVVSLGGCTASFVSPEGLVVTNHHCAKGAIQLNSTPDDNLLENGFIAADRAAEVSAGPAARVLVTVAFDQVTDRILADARGKTGRAYYDAVDAAEKALVAGCEGDEGYRCSVADMYYGTDFYLIKQLELKDIRLVYAPPEAIGNYGDEIDNFMWPRHSGDFAFYRAYVGKDGKPAAYSEDNVPYHPPAWLEVSTAPVAEGDFAMVAGYPGRTYRHRMAMEFAHQVESGLPSRIDLYRSMIDAIETASADDEAAQVAYASTLAGLKNGLKRARGELDGMQRSDAVAVRRADEQAMLAWLAKQPGHEALEADIQAAQALLAESHAGDEAAQLFAQIRGRTELLAAAYRLQRLALERGKPDAARERGYQQRDEARIKAALEQASRRYVPKVEKALLATLLQRHAALPQDQRIAELDAVFGSDPATIAARLDRIYDATALDGEAERLRLLDADPATVAASTDPLMQAAAKLLPAVLREEDADKQLAGELLRLRPAYMQALIGYRQSRGESVYPDANSSLRIAYGHVIDLHPRDAVRYAPVTTVAGIVEKHTGVAPFDAPDKLLAAIEQGDFGSTADPALGTQTVNFLTNLDTTGGNSGSPVLDAHGRLIGLHFDSNWEAVSASWAFDRRYKRGIHVDMRYVRWLMSKVYPAPHLLEEMHLPPD